MFLFPSASSCPCPCATSLLLTISISLLLIIPFFPPLNFSTHYTIFSFPHFLFFLFALLYLLGTPIQNNLEELYAVVQFTVPGYLSSVSDYRKYFAEPISKGQLSRATEKEKKEVSVDISNILFIFDTILFPSSAGVSA